MSALQPSYQRCFVCGLGNPIGLQARFYDEAEQVVSEVTPCADHRGYPGLVHGGVLTALLDEAMSRAAYRLGHWTYSAKIEIRFRRHVALGEPLRVSARLLRDRGRFVEAEGTIALPDGVIATEGRGLYVKLPDEDVQRLWSAIRSEERKEG